MTKPKAMPPAPPVAPFHYLAAGLPDVWLLNGFHLENTPDGPAVRIEDADGLHAALAQGIVAARRPMTPRELRYLRRFLQISQANVAQLLGISEQTVARWEKGETAIDPCGERLVRMIAQEALGQDVIVQAELRALAEADEAIHGTQGQRLSRGRQGWLPVKAA